MSDQFQYDPIDVPYQTASNEELFRQQQNVYQQAEAMPSPAAKEALSLEVQQDPERCFCRDCGQPVFVNASVCPHCRYVINPASLHQAQQIVRARREKYAKGHKVFGVIRQFTGLDFESETSKALFNIQPQRYEFQTSGAVYCTNCGHEVEDGAIKCIYCDYIIDPVAYQNVKLAIEDRQAKFTTKDLLKSLLIPGWGLRKARELAVRRPQVANPCRIAGLVNTGFIAAALVIIMSWL